MKQSAQSRHIAYFSMEVGVNNAIHTYAGGLGILAGDTLKAGADVDAPMVGITLLYKNGYFKQDIIEETGHQKACSDDWDYEHILTKLPQTCTITIHEREVQIGIWKYDIPGGSGGSLPLYFLDADIEGNHDDERAASSYLYSKFPHTRITQEIILGVGGVAAMEALGYQIDTYHLNESHAGFAILALHEMFGNRQEAQNKVVFTTHTPVKHGHTIYEESYVRSFLKGGVAEYIHPEDLNEGNMHMTNFCLHNSRYANAVARKHAETSLNMFPDHTIDAITNGIHTASWTSKITQDVFDEYIDGWRQDFSLLRNSHLIPDPVIAEMKRENKKEMIAYLAEKHQLELSEHVCTLGFARRVDAYKRLNFITQDIERLKKIAHTYGGIQILFSGKAYPDSQVQAAAIQEIVKLSQIDHGLLKIHFIEGYDMELSLKLVSGVDVWLNNPIRPKEASGTSGMKAAANGTMNFSVIDGWWVEGWNENITGWAIGDESSHIGNEHYEREHMYSKLEHVILPMYHNDSKHWIEMMKNAISINGGHFQTHRMLLEYIAKAYTS